VLLQLAVGLSTSVLLLILSLRLSGRPGYSSGAVDSIGVLQLIWLLRGNSEIQERVAKVEEPSVDNLRAAGMFAVSLIDEHQISKGPYDLVGLMVGMNEHSE
jgi:hypothetical protein